MIYIHMATRMEAEPFINGLQLEKVENDFFHVYQSDDMTLVISGVGKMNATMATTFMLTTFSPEKILNLGAAGSLGDEEIGVVFQVESIVEADRPLRHRNNKPRMYTPQTVDGFTNAVLATRDIPVLDPDERKEVALLADLIDMEGCAVAHVCKRFNTPCYLFKFVTDNIQQPDSSHIVENIEQHKESFFNYCAEKILPKF
jgi:adenosylhomocysteine nucleosidase